MTHRQQKSASRVCFSISVKQLRKKGGSRIPARLRTCLMTDYLLLVQPGGRISSARQPFALRARVSNLVRGGIISRRTRCSRVRRLSAVLLIERRKPRLRRHPYSGAPQSQQGERCETGSRRPRAQNPFWAMAYGHNTSPRQWLCLLWSCQWQGPAACCVREKTAPRPARRLETVLKKF